MRAGPTGSASLAVTKSCARLPTMRVLTETAEARPAGGGLGVSNAVELQLSTSDSPAGHESVIVRWKPGFTLTLRAT